MSDTKDDDNLIRRVDAIPAATPRPMRMCLSCGMKVPAEHNRDDPGPGCTSPDACTFDMTDGEAWQYWRQKYHDLRVRAPRPMKDAPRDGVILVVSEMLAKDLRAWADRQEVLEPAHSARRRDLISILQQISSHFLPHPPEGGSDE
jgi:hypothetical protein